VLGDVGEPQHVGAVDGEVALDQVLFGCLVHEVPHTTPGTRKSLDPKLFHDRPDELLVDDHVVVSSERSGDPQHPIGAAGALVEFFDEVHKEQPAHLAVRRHVVLELVVDGAWDPDDLAGGAL